MRDRTNQTVLGVFVGIFAYCLVVLRTIRGGDEGAAERQFGRVRLFINGENLTGVRQTRWDPLIRPSQAADGRWTVDAWAPLEGRNVNGGVRLHF